MKHSPRLYIFKGHLFYFTLNHSTRNDKFLLLILNCYAVAYLRTKILNDHTDNNVFIFFIQIEVYLSLRMLYNVQHVHLFYSMRVHYIDDRFTIVYL